VACEWTVQIQVNDVAHTVQLPASVSINAVGIQGYDSVTRTITFVATGTYNFTFSTNNGGAGIVITETNKALQPFNASNQDLAGNAAANLATTTSYFATAGAETATLAAGVEGQIKVLAMTGDNGDMVVTVTNAGWTGDEWSSAVEYSTGDKVLYNGLSYVSLQDINLNRNPETQDLWWGPIGTITFNAIGQACTLQYINNKWYCIGNNGCVFD
jgi:hypothetical protein